MSFGGSKVRFPEAPPPPAPELPPEEQERRRRARRGPTRNQTLLTGDSPGAPEGTGQTLLGGAPLSGSSGGS